MDTLIKSYETDTNMETLPQTYVTEDKFIPPLAKSSTYLPSYALSIQELFPEQEREEKNIQLAKKSLGALSEELSPIELKNLICETEFLIESWLDEFERKIFKGLTLQELLHEKGSK